MFLTKEKCEELESIVLGKVAEIPRAETLEDDFRAKMQEISVSIAVKVLQEYERMKDAPSQDS